jgi:superoxide dismutase, Cu-Zn family
MRRAQIVPVLATAGLIVAAAAVGSRAQVPHAGGMMAGSPVSHAIAVLQPTKDSKVSGTVTFDQAEGGVKVVAKIDGLTKGPHGFHIHEFGDASSPDGAAAGAHFNPTKADHGAPTSGKRHVGDLGNIEADDSGHASLEVVDPMLSFTGPNSILGRGVVVHAKADDLKTQPSGDAGGRLAVGVIGVTKAAGAAKAK